MTRGAVDNQRLARFVSEVFTSPSDHKTREEWVEALDEALSDLARSFRMEPSVSLLAVLQEMAA